MAVQAGYRGYRVVYMDLLRMSPRATAIHLERDGIGTDTLVDMRRVLGDGRGVVAEVPFPLASALAGVGEPHQLSGARLIGRPRKAHVIAGCACRHQTAEHG